MKKALGYTLMILSIVYLIIRICKNLGVLEWLF